MHIKLTHFVKKSKENAVRFTANSVNVNFYYGTKNIWKRKVYCNSNISKMHKKLTHFYVFFYSIKVQINNFRFSLIRLQKFNIFMIVLK